MTEYRKGTTHQLIATGISFGKAGDVTERVGEITSAATCHSNFSERMGARFEYLYIAITM